VTLTGGGKIDMTAVADNIIGVAGSDALLINVDTPSKAPARSAAATAT
jgi:hypothetical protein